MEAKGYNQTISAADTASRNEMSILRAFLFSLSKTFCWFSEVFKVLVQVETRQFAGEPKCPSSNKLRHRQFILVFSILAMLFLLTST